MNIAINKNDEVVMRLLHYFIIEQNYNPVVLHGAKDEIWLEKTDGDYKIIRIVSNYIHNNEQLNFDIYRTKQIIKKIKKKMFLFKVPSLSIFVNLGDSVDLNSIKDNNISVIELSKFEDIGKYDFVINTFPNILEVEQDDKKGIELFIKLTNEINTKNRVENDKAEEIFSKKKPIITYALIIINLVMFIVTAMDSGDFFNISTNTIYKYGGLVSVNYLKDINDYFRIFTSGFLHAGFIHFIFNMYALYVIGPQIESFFGKFKYTIIYIGSLVFGNLLSLLFLNENVISCGASGAIFGLLGSLLYFGYHYRVYLSDVIRSQIIPLIVINLVIGVLLSGVNVIAHIGGLIGGFLVSKAVGVKYKSTKVDQINGIIMTLIFGGFLIYMIFFR
ncbi:MAG: rhomboid family intramembrane serine protease [Bacilli bacterium]|nr:rhomboid family intramembrane serine protease [Bacilli bacterium]